MAINEPNSKKYYISYVVQPGKPWGHAALLLRSAEESQFGEMHTIKSTLYDFAGKYPYADAYIGNNEFDPANPAIENIEHHLSQYKTWEISEAEFNSLSKKLNNEAAEQANKLLSKDKEDKPLFFHPVTQNCKTFAVQHLSAIKSISSEDLQKLNNPFIPIPVFSGKLNKLKDITKLCESLGKLNLMIEDKLQQKNLLPEQKDALIFYKDKLETAKKNLYKMNTSLPVEQEAEKIINEEFTSLHSATQSCLASLERTKFMEPGIMNELKSLIAKFKEFFAPSLETEMKKLSKPK